MIEFERADGSPISVNPLRVTHVYLDDTPQGPATVIHLGVTGEDYVLVRTPYNDVRDRIELELSKWRVRP